MPTQEKTLDEILDLAAKHFKVPREKLTPDDDFFKTLGIDSLQALDLSIFGAQAEASQARQSEGPVSIEVSRFSSHLVIGLVNSTSLLGHVCPW